MKAKQLSANQFPGLYKNLDVDLTKLGCVMLDVNPEDMPVSDEFDKGDDDIFYTSKNPDYFWIKGLVAMETPHLTLLYGLLKQAKEYKDEIEQVLKDWDLEEVEIESVGYFDSPYKEDPYYCVIAHVKVTPELMEGHQRLQLLPHIDTYPEYKPHITLAYVKYDKEIRDDVIDFFEEELVGAKLKIVQELNLGGNK